MTKEGIVFEICFTVCELESRHEIDSGHAYSGHAYRTASSAKLAISKAIVQVSLADTSSIFSCNIKYTTMYNNYSHVPIINISTHDVIL